MDDRRFDSLVRSLASGGSRRTLFKGFLGLGGAVVVGAAVSGHDAQAARRGFSGPKLPQPCVPTCDGATCGGSDGCGGTCGCGDGHYCSGFGCCENIQLGEAGCFWMENESGLFCWVPTGDDYESCRALDSCGDGGGGSGGGCYKWALSSDTQLSPPWI
jgi:hypothetical protein